MSQRKAILIIVLLTLVALVGVGAESSVMEHLLSLLKSFFITGVHKNDDQVFDSYKNPTLFEEMPQVCSNYGDEDCAVQWLATYEKIASHNRNRLSNIVFDYKTNITRDHENEATEFTIVLSDINRRVVKAARRFKTGNFSDDVKRQLKLISLSSSSDSPDMRKQLANVTRRMSTIYSSAETCPSPGHCLGRGEKAVIDAMQRERDYDKLALMWKAWRDVTGPKIRPYYYPLVFLANIGAQDNGYPNKGYFEWFTDTESPTFDQDMMNMYHGIQPLYQQLHAYVRYRLLQKYPGKFAADGPIPAHIFGDVWALQWDSIIDLVQPYPDVKTADVTPRMQEWAQQRKLSVHKMFEMAEEFYTSIALDNMTAEFWKRSLLEQPKDRIVDCHPSPEDFSNKFDFRIKMCTKIKQDDLSIIHHEMGHVEYYMAYRNQPYAYRDGANSGFHEAIGDTIALAVNTPEHMHKIGLLDEVPTDKKFDINYLMLIALDKVAFLPFALVVERWRWWAFNGTTTPQTYNRDWWKLRLEMQGMIPPVPRSEADFDPGSKHHVANNVPYIRYFMADLMQFQFYKAMCDKSGHKGPLHRCDFYKSKEAGELFKSMLQMGRSRPWPEAMERMTGQREISSAPFMEFFNPLYDWLKEENKKLGLHIGWKLAN